MLSREVLILMFYLSLYLISSNIFLCPYNQDSHKGKTRGVRCVRYTVQWSVYSPPPPAATPANPPPAVPPVPLLHLCDLLLHKALLITLQRPSYVGSSMQGMAPWSKFEMVSIITLFAIYYIFISVACQKISARYLFSSNTVALLDWCLQWDHKLMAQ